jgi:hypothetical protein
MAEMESLRRDRAQTPRPGRPATIYDRSQMIPPHRRLKITLPTDQHTPQPKTPKEQLVFGKVFSDHMLEIDWDDEVRFYFFERLWFATTIPKSHGCMDRVSVCVRGVKRLTIPSRMDECHECPTQRVRAVQVARSIGRHRSSRVNACLCVSVHRRNRTVRTGKHENSLTHSLTHASGTARTTH